MVRRDILEFAVLGVLADGPIHGYELRKQLTEMLGPFRSLSYGTLYPTLRRLVNRQAIEPVSLTPQEESPGMRSKRARIVYALTAEGKEEFEQWANRPGSNSWDDEAFTAHMAFFSRTERRARLRILHGRRSWLNERLNTLRTSLSDSRGQHDPYTASMRSLNVESTEREMRWLDELIESEENNTTTAHIPLDDKES
jgi:DNA-binding PadR family transcriptional regulator